MPTATPIPVVEFDEIDSTSLQARRLVDAGEVASALLLAARRQTAGVGRHGRAWASPEGGLWCTLVWPLARGREGVLAGLSMRVALACLHAVDGALAHRPRAAPATLKWPNDVMLDGRKVAGALCEALRRPAGDFLLIGVGVNANFSRAALPPELRQTATTLQEAAGAPIELRALRQSLLDSLAAACTTSGLTHAERRTIRARLHGKGKDATVSLPNREQVRGVLIGIDDLGRPQLDTPDGAWTAPPGVDLVLSE